MQVGDAGDSGHLLQHEEDRAVLHQGSPVAPPDHVALLLAQAGFLERGFGVVGEQGPVLGDDQVVQELVQPVVADAAVQVEGIGALQRFDPGQLLAGLGPCGLGGRGAHRFGLVLVDGGGDRRHGGQVVAAVHAPDTGRQRPACDHPHHELRALHAAQARVVGMGHAGEGDGILLVEVEQFVVPGGVVEAAALALHLVGQAPGGHQHDLQVLWIALDGVAQRLAELVAALGGRHRELQHAHLQRHDRDRPVRLVRHHHRQGREAAVVERLVLEEGHVELVGHQGLADVPGEGAVRLDRRQVAGTAALVGHRILVADAQAEG